MTALYNQKYPKAKPSSKSNSPTKLNQKMRGKQWKNKRRSHVPTDTNPHHQTFEYNHQPQGVHNSPPQNQLRNSPLYPNQLFSTPPFLLPPILPLGPISLLPPVQSSPIGNTCPEDVQWRLVPHPSDLLCHPEQMGQVVYRSGHIGEMGESGSKRSLFPVTPLSPRLCRSPNPFTILEKPKYVPG